MGCIGTFYLFGEKLFQTEQAVNNQQGGTNESNFAIVTGTDEAVDGDFDEYVDIATRQTAGQRFSFLFKKDVTASRYVMEMGDGVRLIVTQPNLTYQYDLPGKYTIELKEIKNGLLNLIGTKTIKVK